MMHPPSSSSSSIATSLLLFLLLVLLRLLLVLSEESSPDESLNSTLVGKKESTSTSSTIMTTTAPCSDYSSEFNKLFQSLFNGSVQCNHSWSSDGLNISLQCGFKSVSFQLTSTLPFNFSTGKIICDGCHDKVLTTQVDIQFVNGTRKNHSIATDVDVGYNRIGCSPSLNSSSVDFSFSFFPGCCHNISAVNISISIADHSNVKSWMWDLFQLKENTTTNELTAIDCSKGDPDNAAAVKNCCRIRDNETGDNGCLHCVAFEFPEFSSLPLISTKFVLMLSINFHLCNESANLSLSISNGEIETASKRFTVMPMGPGDLTFRAMIIFKDLDPLEVNYLSVSGETLNSVETINAYYVYDSETSLPSTETTSVSVTSPTDKMADTISGSSGASISLSRSSLSSTEESNELLPSLSTSVSQSNLLGNLTSSYEKSKSYTLSTATTNATTSSSFLSLSSSTTTTLASTTSTASPPSSSSFTNTTTSSLSWSSSSLSLTAANSTQETTTTATTTTTTTAPSSSVVSTTTATQSTITSSLFLTLLAASKTIKESDPLSSSSSSSSSSPTNSTTKSTSTSIATTTSSSLSSSLSSSTSTRTSSTSLSMSSTTFPPSPGSTLASTSIISSTSSTTSLPSTSTASTTYSTSTTSTASTTESSTSTTTSTVSTVAVFHPNPFKLTNETYSEDLNKNESILYKNLYGYIRPKLSRICSATIPDKFLNVTELRFSPGSVIVNSTLEISSGLSVDEIRRLNEAIQNGFQNPLNIVAVVVGSVVGLFVIIIIVLLSILCVRWWKKMRIPPPPLQVPVDPPSEAQGAYVVPRPPQLLWQSSVGTSSLSRRGQSGPIELLAHKHDNGGSHVGEEETEGVKTRARNRVNDPALKHFTSQEDERIDAAVNWNCVIPRPELGVRLDRKHQGESPRVAPNVMVTPMSRDYSPRPTVGENGSRELCGPAEAELFSNKRFLDGRGLTQTDSHSLSVTDLTHSGSSPLFYGHQVFPSQTPVFQVTPSPSYFEASPSKPAQARGVKEPHPPAVFEGLFVPALAGKSDHSNGSSTKNLMSSNDTTQANGEKTSDSEFSWGSTEGNTSPLNDILTHHQTNRKTPTQFLAMFHETISRGSKPDYIHRTPPTRRQNHPRPQLTLGNGADSGV